MKPLKDFYELGPTYIWQNCNIHPEYNGRETTVIGHVAQFEINGVIQWGQEVDEKCNGKRVAAFEGQLRPKNPPSGERGIREMFLKEYNKEEENV